MLLQSPISQHVQAEGPPFSNGIRWLTGAKGPGVATDSNTSARKHFHRNSVMHMMATWHGTAFPITGLVWGETISHRGIQLTMGQYCWAWIFSLLSEVIGGFNSQWVSIAELGYFHCCQSERIIEQTVEMRVILDAMMLLWGLHDVIYTCYSRFYPCSVPHNINIYISGRNHSLILMIIQAIAVAVFDVLPRKRDFYGFHHI